MNNGRILFILLAALAFIILGCAPRPHHSRTESGAEVALLLERLAKRQDWRVMYICPSHEICQFRATSGAWELFTEGGPESIGVRVQIAYAAEHVATIEGLLCVRGCDFLPGREHIALVQDVKRYIIPALTALEEVTTD